MNRRSILTKTGKGLMEATGKTSNLSRDLRNILKEIDGKVSVNELLEKFDKLTEQKLLELLSSMEKDGYVREFIGKQDEGPRTPVGRASGPPSLGDGSDLDFTAFTPAKPNAKASEDARLQAQAQEIARQAQATRAREEATSKALKARNDATAAARAKADAEQRAKQAAVTRTGSHTPLPPLINPTVTPPVVPPVVGILGAGPEAQARAQADAQVRTQAEALERARREAEEKARKDAEEKARQEAEARARAEIEAAIKREAEERALREIQERTRREEAERARREAEARAKLEAEQRARREAEERQRRDLEERTRREVEERLRREEAERRRREEEERARREAERQARIEAETKARVDAELRAKREAEERVRHEDEERRQGEKRKRTEDEQRKRQEAEQAAALERALKEEQEKAEREAEQQAARAEHEERGREEHELREREEPILEDDDEEKERREEEERYAKEEAKRAREEERAAAKASAKARKAERARERAGEEAWRGDEDALRDTSGASLSAAEAWERRKPRSFLRTLGVMLVVLAILGVAALPFVPLDTAPYEKSAQAWLGLPVKIGSLTVTYFPVPQLKFEKIAIGRDPQMRAAVIKASPDLATLLDDRTKLQSLSMENVTVPKEFLAALLQDRPGSRGLGVQRITAKGLKIDAPELGLPGLDFEASLSPDGTLRSASLSNGGQLTVRIEPKGGKAAVEISAAALPIPIGVEFGLSDFSAKGIASASDLALSSIEGRAFGGRILGSARLRWSSGWSLDADLSARQMDAAKLAGPLLGAGTLQGKGRVSMKGLLPERMVLNSQIDGNFSVQKGSISNVDMPRLLQGSGSGGGTTLFQELTGDFTADPNRLLVRNIRLAAGLLSGLGQVEMDPQMNLSGRMQIELRAQSVQARSTLGVSGTLANPQFRRAN